MTFEPEKSDSLNNFEAPSEQPAQATSGSELQPEYSKRLRFTTITWGLILLAGGVGVMALATGYTFDAQLALIAVLTVAGFTLVGGSIVRAISK